MLLKADRMEDSASVAFGVGRGEQPDRRQSFAPPEVITAGLTVLALLSGLWLRWSHLGRLSLWFDEGFTAFGSGLSFPDVIRYAQSTDSPPLYLLLQHAWGALFGNSEYALRALSALFGTLSLPVFYLLAKKVLKDSMAVALAIWLFAFSVVQLWFSQEARTYEVASFFSLVSLYALVLFLERRSVTLFALIVLSVTATLYMHNMMFFYLLALNVTWLIYPSERAWTQRFKEAFLADILVGVLYLPWVPSLLHQVAIQVVHKGFWAPRPTASTLLRTLMVLSGFNVEYLLWVGVRFLPLSSHTVSLFVRGGAGVLCAAMVAGGLWYVPKEGRRRNVSLLVYCLLPALSVFAVSQITTPIYTDHRIFIDSSIVIPIVLAYPLALRKTRWERVLFGLLGIVLGATIALSGFGFTRYQEKEDWRGATSILLRIPDSERLIVFMARSGEILFDYYAQRLPPTDPSAVRMGLPIGYREAFPPPRVGGPITGVSDVPQLKRAVESRKYPEIDLVLSHESMDDPDELILNYLSQVYVRQAEQRFNGIRILRFQAPPGGSK